jgi:hypothetical protein
MNYIRYAILTMCVIFFSNDTWANDQKTLRLSVEQLICVKNNIKAYKEVQSSPFVIVLPACPIADVTEAISALAENNMFQRKPESAQLNSIIRLSERDLDCLVARVSIDTQSPLVMTDGEWCDE